jgi:hypothetical protein
LAFIQEKPFGLSLSKPLAGLRQAQAERLKRELEWERFQRATLIPIQC